MKKQLEKTLQGFLEKNQVLKLDVKVCMAGYAVFCYDIVYTSSCSWYILPVARPGDSWRDGSRLG